MRSGLGFLNHLSQPPILRYEDLDPDQNPTGESLINRQRTPYQVWVPKEQILVLGASQDPSMELRLEQVKQDSIPVYKRRSGGGAVLLSSGCLCIGLRFAKQKELAIQDYFQMGANLIRKVSAEVHGLNLESRGISDLVVGDRKVAGCAMYMPRDFVLYLVSVLLDPDFSEIEKYLAYPSKQPEYRQGRSHSDFLGGLDFLSQQKIDKAKLLDRFNSEIQSSLIQFLDMPSAGG